ncbi:MAG TPA: RluA family pseudouridine synthase, partial [Pyrinomonadaceae bacterium]|nr:RluA family pseudouridine synthase [Pyrinomonadaceae bacterium]
MADVGPDQEILTFHVALADAGVRLDAYLATRIEGWSRARLQRLIEAEDVLVNGKPAKPSYKLRENDALEVDLTVPAAASFAPEPIPIEIVYEDEALIVVNKPAGLVVHPAAGIHSGTLANALAYHFQQLPDGGAGVRPGIVHRLDRDTSGLL